MNTTILKHCREGEKMSSATMHRMNCHHGAATAKGKLSPIAKSLLLLCALTVSFAVKAQTTLFETPFSTTYNNTTLSMPYRIPALVETENATTGAKELIYFGDKRHCGMDIGWGSSASAFGSNYYRIDIVARRSTDGGATWEDETIVKEGTASCGYGDVAVVSNHENPKEIMFMAATGNVRYGASTYGTPLKTTRFYSSDGGQSWNSTDLTSSMYSLVKNVCSSVKALFFTSGRICQSKQIRVGEYYRIYSALCVNSGGSNSFVVYSDDFGASWNVLGGGMAVSGGDEATVEELPNGNVLISSRKSSAPSSTSAGRRDFRVFKYNDIKNVEKNTADGSWETNTYSGVQWGGSWKGTNGELLLVPAKDADGNACNIMLHSAPYGTGLTNGRDNVSIFWRVLSSDAITSASVFSGTNWNRYSVSTTTSAYSTMILQHDGTVSIAYEENQWGYSIDSNVNYRVAPTASGDLTKWSDLGYNLMYQNLSLATITGNQYSYYAGEEEENPVVETVATPAISPASGEVASGAEISISCTTDGATIYYTLDGTTPSASNGAKYTAPFALTADATVSAIAILSGYNDSEVATATYTIKVVSGGDDDEPTTTVTKYRFKNVQKGGNVYYFQYAGETEGLKLVTSESNATLYTRTVNSDGTYSYQDSKDGYYLIWSGRNLSNGLVGYNSGLGYSKEYNASYCNLTIEQMVAGNNVESFSGTYYTVKGKRLDNGNNNDVYFVIKNGGTFDGASAPFYNSNYSSAFVIEEVEVEVEGGEVVETVATPVISPNGGEVESGTAISISCTTDGAAIYYTLDGTTPSASNGTKYTAPFALTANATVSAIAILDGFNDSEVATATFTIKEEEVVETEEWITSIINCDKESCSASSYSTLYLDYAVELPSGVKAYRGVLNAEEATLTLYQIKTGVVPALCAVIIENTHVGSSITLTKTTTTATYTNDLKGTLVAIAGIDPSNYYVLGHTAQYHLGFYHPNSTTLAANKAYIEWSSSNARSLTIKRGDDEGTTAISEMESIENAVIYNLLGQRVYHMESGKIYIVNGKKVVIK